MKFLKNFDKHFNKHRDDLSKYCYDMSKIFVVILVLNPFFEKNLHLSVILMGLLIAVMFIIFGMLFKK